MLYVVSQKLCKFAKYTQRVGSKEIKKHNKWPAKIEERCPSGLVIKRKRNRIQKNGRGKKPKIKLAKTEKEFYSVIIA